MVVNNKLILKKKIDALKKAGKRIGLCDGNYDLLHQGHVLHFESAKKMCDVLVVSIARDERMRERKGKGRPVFTERWRAYMVNQLKAVDFVIINPTNNGIMMLELLKPQVYIRGPDYRTYESATFSEEKHTARVVGATIRYTKDIKFATRDLMQAIKEERTYI